jgi:hypothetical protein
MKPLKTVPGELAPDDKRITRKEARDLLTALDKPEFGGLMDDYLKEISDPNNIKETNQFLKESQEKKDLPANVRLAKPTPGFCIRSQKYSIKHPSQRKKVFINIVSLDEVQAPESNESNMWKLPYLLNKGRHDQDKKGKFCTTFDVVFNPKAIELANDNLSFKKFVCDTAINGINEQILAKEEEKISNDYVVKKFNYKGLEVSYVNVHTLTKGEMDDRKEPSEFHKTEIMKEVEKIKAENEKKKEEEKKGEEDVDVYDQPDIDNKDNVNDVIKTKKMIDKDSKEPIYKIKYSDNFELNNFFYNPQGYEEAPKKDYKKLIIEINTPLMAGVADAELEVDVKKLKFKYKDIYLLNLDLPIEINKDSTTAKFDKTKKILSLTSDIVHKKQAIPEKKIDEKMEIINEEEEKRKEEELKKKEEEERIKKEMEEKQKKEEEEKKKLEEEEMRIKREKEKQEKEKQEKERLEKEKLKKEEEKEKNKEDIVFIRGKKSNNENPLIKNNESQLKEIKYKEENETNKEENKKFVEEIIPKKEEEEIDIREDEINTTVPMKKQIEILRKKREEKQKNANDDKNKKNTKKNEVKKDEKEKKIENKKHDEDDIIQKQPEKENKNVVQKSNAGEDTRTPTCFLSFSNDWVYEID